MDCRSPAAAKRLWNIVRVVFYMLRKNLNKRTLTINLTGFFNRSKIAGKAVGELMQLPHQSLKGCRSNSVAVSAFAPKEYEFSCSETPAYSFPFQNRRRRHRHHDESYVSYVYPQYIDEEVPVVAVKKVFDALDRSEVNVCNWESAIDKVSPMPSLYPFRITDSPFSVKEDDQNDGKIDMEAEEFIERFYAQLKLQRWKAALDARCRQSATDVIT